MTDMLEKVARELAGHIQELSWDELPEHRKAVIPRAEWGKLCFRDMARAAISVLMEPTEEMQNAGADLCADIFDADFHKEHWPYGEVTKIWQAMLEAALGEPFIHVSPDSGTTYDPNAEGYVYRKWKD